MGGAPWAVGGVLFLLGGAGGGGFVGLDYESAAGRAPGAASRNDASGGVDLNNYSRKGLDMPATKRKSTAAAAEGVSTAAAALTGDLQAGGLDDARRRSLVEGLVDALFKNGATPATSLRTVKALVSTVQWPAGDSIQRRCYRMGQVISWSIASDVAIRVKSVD